MLAGQIADALEPEMLAETDFAADTTMEEFADALRQQTADASLEQAYMQEQLQSYRGLENVEEMIVRELVAYRQPVTANNLEAAAGLRKKPGALYRKLRDLENGTDIPEGRQKAEKLLENLTDKESAQEAYEEMQETFSGLLDRAADASEDFLSENSRYPAILPVRAAKGRLGCRAGRKKWKKRWRLREKTEKRAAWLFCRAERQTAKATQRKR